MTPAADLSWVPSFARVGACPRCGATDVDLMARPLLIGEGEVELCAACWDAVEADQAQAQEHVARAVLCAAYWCAQAKGTPGARGEAAAELVRAVADQAEVDAAGALRWLTEAEASASAHDPLLVAINLAMPRAPR